MTERLHFRFSLSRIGEGNGSPLQCSCLENPRDGGAWWAAIYGVAQRRTRLKRLSSSSSSVLQGSALVFRLAERAGPRGCSGDGAGVSGLSVCIRGCPCFQSSARCVP